jgi:hypothetical protein
MVMTFMVVVVVVLVVTKKMKTTTMMMVTTTTKIVFKFCETVSSIIHKTPQTHCPINVRAVIFCQNEIFRLICKRN